MFILKYLKKAVPTNSHSTETAGDEEEETVSVVSNLEESDR